MDDPSRITITICGDGGCGKSSITLRLVRSQWTSDYDPTIEDSYSITRRIDGQTYHLSLTDTAGQEEYRGMWGGANLRSDAFLLVYDITNAHSLGQLEYFNELIDMETETRLDAAAAAGGSPVARHGRGSSKSTENVVLPVKIVAGNKCDLQESRQVDAKTGLEWARRRGCGFMETSARNVVNIEETFALIVRRVVEKRRRAAAGEPLGGQGESVGAGGGGGGGGRVRARGYSAGTASASAGGAGAGARGGRAVGKARSQTLRLPAEEEYESGARLRERFPGVGTRRAVTAPLSPLPVNGDGSEKGQLGRRGPRGGPRGGGNFWGKLRCW